MTTNERSEFTNLMGKFITAGIALSDMWNYISDGFGDELNGYEWPFTLSFDEFIYELITINNKIADKVKR